MWYYRYHNSNTCFFVYIRNSKLKLNSLCPNLLTPILVAVMKFKKLSLIVWYYILETRIHISCFSRQKQVYTVGHQKHHFNFQTLTDINQIISVEYTAYYLWTIDEHSFICHNFENINFKIPWISKKNQVYLSKQIWTFYFFLSALRSFYHWVTEQQQYMYIHVHVKSKRCYKFGNFRKL